MSCTWVGQSLDGTTQSYKKLFFFQILQTKSRAQKGCLKAKNVHKKHKKCTKRTKTCGNNKNACKTKKLHKSKEK